MGGNIKSYIRLLDKFSDNQQHAITNISMAMIRNDHTTAIRTAHTLKGTAGSIGAVRLQKIAAQLETKLNGKQSSNYIQLLDATSIELNHILTVIQASKTTPDTITKDGQTISFINLGKNSIYFYNTLMSTIQNLKIF